MTPQASPSGKWERYEAIFADVEAPFAFVDLDAMWLNAADLLRRAGGTPVRVASKSVRCRALLERILERDAGFQGLMTFTAAETVWLTDSGFDDLLLAYPTTDKPALAELAGMRGERRPIVMVDSVEQLELIEAAATPADEREPLRLCIELDTAYWIAGGRVRVGANAAGAHGRAGGRARARDRRPRRVRARRGSWAMRATSRASATTRRRSCGAPRSSGSSAPRSARSPSAAAPWWPRCGR